jgi:hypothetical protein
VDREATAFWGRGAVYDWFLNAMFYDPATNTTALQLTMNTAENALNTLEGATEDVYINWLSLNEADAVQRAYGENLPRLRELKADWDPENFFANNFNILPSSG